MRHHFLYFVILIALAMPVQGVKAESFLWKTSDDNNTVYLLGSIHALRAQDLPLPDIYMNAYEDAEKVVLEVDLSNDTLRKMNTVIMDMGVFKGDQSLSGVLGEKKFEELSEQAREHGLSLRLVDHYEPWYASLFFAQIMMVQAGLSPELGVDKYFEDLARQDGKDLDQLETPEQQLGYFDNMRFDLQILLLEQTLRDFDKGREQIVTMIESWKAGDDQKLVSILEDDAALHPKIADILLTKRNKQWVDPIAGFIESDRDTLVIVGAMHLVGPDNVIALLEKQGYQFKRIAQ